MRSEPKFLLVIGAKKFHLANGTQARVAEVDMETAMAKMIRESRICTLGVADQDYSVNTFLMYFQKYLRLRITAPIQTRAFGTLIPEGGMDVQAETVIPGLVTLEHLKRSQLLMEGLLKVLGM